MPEPPGTPRSAKGAATPPAVPGERLPPPLPSASRVRPGWCLLFLTLSLIGFAGVAGILYAYKFLGVAKSLGGFLTRDLFVLSLGLAASPFLLTVRQRVPLPFLVLPPVLVFLLYPIFSPYGLPYSRDAVFNFQFAQAIVNTGTWIPNLDVTGQAGVYSYFPAGAVFNAEAASVTGLPVLQTFPWAFELFRLLVIPLAVYALASRLFSRRSAPLAVFLYMAVPSIEFNVPTQQDFGIPWLCLTLLALTYLLHPGAETTALRVLTTAFSWVAVVSHHLTSYLVAAWLAGLAFLPWIFRRKAAYPRVRPFAVFLSYLLVLLLFAGLVTTSVVQDEYSILSQNVYDALHPGSRVARAAAPGSSFPLHEALWVGLAAAAIVLFSLFALRALYRRRRHAPTFATFSILTALMISLVALPFVSTGFSFLSLRLLEYAGLLFCPAAAWWLARLANRRRAPSPAPPARLPLARLPPRLVGWAVMGIAFLVFTGGSLIPLSTRDQFASPNAILIDSPNFVDENAYRAALWADAHLNRTHHVWGDELVYVVYGGFGHFPVRWDTYPLFNGTGFNASTLSRVHVGDYVVTDVYLTRTFLQPEFPGPPTSQPFGPLLPVELQKFQDPRYFSVVFQDSIFTVYQVESIPPPSAG